jgi:hypothetical protein
LDPYCRFKDGLQSVCPKTECPITGNIQILKMFKVQNSNDLRHSKTGKVCPYLEKPIQSRAF